MIAAGSSRHQKFSEATQTLEVILVRDLFTVKVLTGLVCFVFADIWMLCSD